MPTTRKSTRLSAGGGKQSTLSFNHRVTKNTISKSAKDSLVKPSTATTTTIPSSPNKDESPPPSIDDISPPASPLEEETAEAPAPKSEAELKAAQISHAAIARYWGKIDSARMARAVHKKHTEGLTTEEKVLRYFDVSSQYGPCIGVTRLKRWQRAERLGLGPPIEVLAALIKEEEAQGKGRGVERAHMDELMNFSAVGAA